MKLDVTGNILWCKTYRDTASTIGNIGDFEFTSTGMILISDLQWSESAIITVDSMGVVNTVKRNSIPAQGAYRYSKIIKRNNTQYFIKTSDFWSGGVYLIDSIGNIMSSVMHGFEHSDFCIINNNFFFLAINNGYSTGLIKLDTSFQSMCLYNSGANPAIDYSIISDTTSLISVDTLNAFHYPVSDSMVNFSTYTRCIELSLEEPKADNIYSIYPNPSSGYISIGSLNGKMPDEIEIYSLLGNKITRINSLDTDMHRIELHLNSGVYFVKIKRDYGFEIHRLLIE